MSLAAELNDEQLIAAHERIHGDITDPAVVQAHHTITTEMVKRGLDHGHTDDDWAKAVIEVAKAESEFAALNVDFPAEVIDEVRKELGNPEKVAVTTLLGVDGYTAKIDALEKADGYTPPESVRAAARRALRWIEDGFAGDGFTAVGRTRARQLADGATLSPQTIKRMYSYFARHEVDKQGEGFYDSAEPSPGRVAWDAWGGDAGFKWVKSLTERMEKDADVPLDPVQEALYRGLESVAEQIDGFDKGVGPTGAHYIAAEDNVFADKGINCANCVFFRGGGACEIVKGEIEPDAACKFWIIPAHLVEEEQPEFETEEDYIASLDDIDKAFFSGVAKMLDAGLDPEQELILKGNPEPLRDYWRSGGKGKISWGAGGDFTACVAAVGKYMSSEEAKGYCAIRHREVTGMWPGSKANRMHKSQPENVTYVINLPDGSVFKHGSHDQKSHSGKGGGSDEMTGDDLTVINRNMNRRSMRLVYNDAYDKGAEYREQYGTRSEETYKKNLSEALSGLRTYSQKRTMESELYSDRVLTSQGLLDGLRGSKRRLRNTWTGMENPLYMLPAFGKSEEFEPVVKHPGNHDQKVHAGGRGRSTTTSEDPRGAAPRGGMGDVGVSDEDFAAMQQGSAGPHILGRREDGSPIFSAERQALHDKIVSDIVDGVPSQDNPTFYMLGGGPAAGKSTMLKAGTVSVPTGKQAAQINADDIKAQIPDYDSMTKSGDKRAAAFSHEESSYIAKRAQAAAFERSQDVVLDGTGDSSVRSLSGKIEKARRAGYRVEGMYATVPTQVAVDRANARGERTGRFVPESVIRSTHASVSQVFPEGSKLFDRVSLYDTTNGARLIASASRGKLKIVDNDGYTAFLAKGDEA